MHDLIDTATLFARCPPAPHRRLIVVNAAHAERLFPGDEAEHTRRVIAEALARTKGAVLVLTTADGVRTIAIENGGEIAEATATIVGAVAFQMQALDCGHVPGTVPPIAAPCAHDHPSGKIR